MHDQSTASTALVTRDADGLPTTTSLAIADGTGNQHKNVLELIRNNISDFEEFGRVAFETRVAGQSPNPTKYAVLNEQHATLLLTYMRNSEIVKAFKKRLVAEFFAMRQALAETAPALTEDELIHQALVITTGRVTALAELAGRLATKIADDRPLTERGRTHAGGRGEKNRRQFFREVKQWAQDEHQITVKEAHVIEFLSTRKLGLFTRTDAQATSWAVERGYAVNRDGTADNGHNYTVGRLTASGQEYAWERIVRYIDANGTLELPRQIGGAA